MRASGRDFDVFLIYFSLTMAFGVIMMATVLMLMMVVWRALSLYAEIDVELVASLWPFAVTPPTVVRTGLSADSPIFNLDIIAALWIAFVNVYVSDNSRGLFASSAATRACP